MTLFLKWLYSEISVLIKVLYDNLAPDKNSCDQELNGKKKSSYIVYKSVKLSTPIKFAAPSRRIFNVLWKKKVAFPLKDA